MKNLRTSHQFAITLIPAVIILLLAVILTKVMDNEISFYTRDVTSIAGIHPLAGFLSNLGIYLWCTSASICAFAAWLYWSHKEKHTFWFLFSSFLLSFYLMVDDAFLVHERLANSLFGVGEKAVILALGIAVLSYLIFFKNIILKTGYVIFVASLGFLAFSVLVDLFQTYLEQILGTWRILAEDGFKWLGIVFWCSYYVRTSYLFAVKANQTETTQKKVTQLRG